MALALCTVMGVGIMNSGVVVIVIEVSRDANFVGVLICVCVCVCYVYYVCTRAREEGRKEGSNAWRVVLGKCLQEVRCKCKCEE